MNAVYQALLAPEVIPGLAEVAVHTTYPIAGWAQDFVNRPMSSVVQAATVTEWRASLQQSSKWATSPLGKNSSSSGAWLPTEMLQILPRPGPAFKEGRAPEPEDTWSTDGSCGGRPATLLEGGGLSAQHGSKWVEGVANDLGGEPSGSSEPDSQGQWRLAQGAGQCAED